MALRSRRRSSTGSRRRPRSWRRSMARSVATGIRPRWCGACGPGSRPQRLRKGTTAMTATSRRRFKPSVSSSLPSAASRALAPIRSGAPLPTFRRKLLGLRRRFPRPPSPRRWRAALRRRPVRRLNLGWVRPSLAPQMGSQRRPRQAPLQGSRPLRPLRAQMGLAAATLRCAPAWRHWRWSLRLLSAAPMGARLSLTAGRRLT